MDPKKENFIKSLINLRSFINCPFVLNKDQLIFYCKRKKIPINRTFKKDEILNIIINRYKQRLQKRFFPCKKNTIYPCLQQLIMSYVSIDKETYIDAYRKLEYKRVRRYRQKLIAEEHYHIDSEGRMFLDSEYENPTNTQVIKWFLDVDYDIPKKLLSQLDNKTLYKLYNSESFDSSFVAHYTPHLKGRRILWCKWFKYNSKYARKKRFGAIYKKITST